MWCGVDVEGRCGLDEAHRELVGQFASVRGVRDRVPASAPCVPGVLQPACLQRDLAERPCYIVSA